MSDAQAPLLPPPPSSEPEPSVHVMSPEIEPGNLSLLLLATKNSEGIPSRKARVNTRSQRTCMEALGEEVVLRPGELRPQKVEERGKLFLGLPGPRALWPLGARALSAHACPVEGTGLPVPLAALPSPSCSHQDHGESRRWAGGWGPGAWCAVSQPPEQGPGRNWDLLRLPVTGAWAPAEGQMASCRHLPGSHGVGPGGPRTRLVRPQGVRLWLEDR